MATDLQFNNSTADKQPVNDNNRFDIKHHLTGDETKQVLTPFAFKIDKSLFGLPLASPLKRGIAITIDGLLIAMLSSAPGELLAIVIAVTLYRLGSQQRAEEMGYVKGRKRRKLMRFTAAFATFIVLLSVLPDAFNDLGWSDSDKYNGSSYGEDDNTYNDNTDKVFNELTAEKGEMVASKIGDQLLFSLAIAQAVSNLSSQENEQECLAVDCWFQALEPSVLTLDETSLSFTDKKKLLNVSVEELDVPDEIESQLISKLSGLLTPSVIESSDANDIDGGANIDNETERISEGVGQEHISPVDMSKSEMSQAEMSEEESSKPASQHSNSQEKDSTSTSDKPVYSVVELVKGIIQDLGLGFGWAAFYFTALTAVWGGQTPGKKLCGIRVIQLDGTPLSLWDSFGRYGGYGAGIATGLLGFLQIFWDANRQAIHDKISATVVIDAKALARLK